MQEFYFRDKGDPKYVPNQFETNNEDEALMYNCKLIVTTDYGDVLGSPLFGTDESSNIGEKNVNPESIGARLYNAIKKFSKIGRERNITVNANVYTVDNADVIVANVTVDNKNLVGFILD